jgi:predicted O-methyltransferase YrrM
METGVAVSESGKTHRIHSHITLDAGLFLEEAALEAKPSVSLEIGLAYGISTLFICEALRETPNWRHIVIDPYQIKPSSTHVGFEGVGLENLRKAGYEQAIEFHDKPSYLALPELVSKGTRVDFAFVDGWHTFDFASVDFFYVDLMLRPGGIVVIDDTNFPSVWDLCRYIVTNRAYSVVRCLPTPDIKTRHPWRWWRLNGTRRIASAVYQAKYHNGLVPHSRCIAFRKNAEDTRSWDFHRPF